MIVPCVSLPFHLFGDRGGLWGCILNYDTVIIISLSWRKLNLANHPVFFYDVAPTPLMDNEMWCVIF